MNFRIIKGDLIKLALNGEFDVIAHGTNCFCLQGAGIAYQMSNIFKSNLLPLENTIYRGDYNKMGQIDSGIRMIYNETKEVSVIANDIKSFEQLQDDWSEYTPLIIVNAYTQYNGGRVLDYDALTLCMRKINKEFNGKHIGLPLIGCGIAGGLWSIVRNIIENELKDCKVTIVEYDG